MIPERFSRYHVEAAHPGVIISGTKTKRKGIGINNKPVARELEIRSFLFVQIIRVGIVRAITEE